MAASFRCSQCQHDTEVLRNPFRTLRWTKYWGYAFASSRARPLRKCPSCGSIFRHNGDLIAAGATTTEHEESIIRYQNDMKGMRAAFRSVFAASAIGVGWTLWGPLAYDMMVTLLIGAVGVGSLIPAGYFGTKVRAARTELREIKAARKEGKIFE